MTTERGILTNPAYKKIVSAIESGRPSAATLVRVSIELADVVDTSDCSSALSWVSRFLNTVETYWSGEERVSDSLTILMHYLAKEVTSRLSSLDREPAIGELENVGKKYLSSDSDSYHDERLCRFLELMSVGFKETRSLKEYIDHCHDQNIPRLLDMDIWQIVRRVDDLYEFNIKEHVSDQIQSTLRGSLFCPPGMTWLYRSTQELRAPHAVCLIPKDIERSVVGRSLSETEKEMNRAVSNAKLEFYIDRDGELWLPFLGRSMSVRAVFEMAEMSHLYEALRAYHLGGLLMIADKSEVAERFYSQVFVKPMMSGESLVNSVKRVHAIRDRRAENTDLKKGLQPLQKSRRVEVEYWVPSHVRCLPSNKSQSKEALRRAEEAFHEGRLCLSDLELLRANKTLTFVSDHFRNEGAKREVLLKKIEDNN